MQRVVLVTGAASGTGRATAHIFFKGELVLVLCDVNEEGLKAVDKLKALGQTVETVIKKVNISSEEQVQSLVNAGMEAFEGVHYVVNNVGIIGQSPTADWLCQRFQCYEPLL